MVIITNEALSWKGLGALTVGWQSDGLRVLLGVLCRLLLGMAWDRINSHLAMQQQQHRAMQQQRQQQQQLLQQLQQEEQHELQQQYLQMLEQLRLQQLQRLQQQVMQLQDQQQQSQQRQGLPLGALKLPTPGSGGARHF